MTKKTVALAIACTMAAVGILIGAENADARGVGNPHPPGEVYVTSQGLYYDTFVTNFHLPPHGRFQKLENGTTEFGPGDVGYLGGRWWIDANGNNKMDAGDGYVLCPLMGPGRTMPR